MKNLLFLVLITIITIVTIIINNYYNNIYSLNCYRRWRSGRKHYMTLRFWCYYQNIRTMHKHHQKSNEDFLLLFITTLSSTFIIVFSSKFWVSYWIYISHWLCFLFVMLFLNLMHTCNRQSSVTSAKMISPVSQLVANAIITEKTIFL